MYHHLLYNYDNLNTGNILDDIDVHPLPKKDNKLKYSKNTCSFHLEGPPVISKNVDRVRVRVMVFNATFNNISVILWQSVLLILLLPLSTCVALRNKRKNWLAWVSMM